MPDPNRISARFRRRPYVIELAVGAFCFIAALLVSGALPGQFVLSRAIPWLWLSLYAVAVIAAFGSFALLQRRQRRSYPDDPAGQYNPTVVNLALSAMVMAILYVLLLHALPRWLHRRSATQPVTLIEPVRMVRSDERGRGSCRRQVRLPKNSALAGLTLCVYSDELYTQIARTRTIEVSGRASKFGIAVHDFRAVPADARDADTARRP